MQISVSYADFVQVLDVILGGYNASVNFYMFHGGTNFGFTAGANNLSDAPFYAPDVTSYGKDGEKISLENCMKNVSNLNISRLRRTSH